MRAPLRIKLTLLVVFLGTCPGPASAIRIRNKQDPREALPNWAKAPLVWVHTPKTGTSFVNTLLHHKGFCPNYPADAWFEGGNGHAFFANYDLNELCPGTFLKEHAILDASRGVADIWENNHDNVVSFFREPESRMKSGFYNHWHDWPHTLKKETYGRNIRGYAQVLQGCQVRMLTFQSYGGIQFNKTCGGNGTNPTVEDVQLAISRMKQMKFIGLFEEWDLSICLFHTLYGGECHDNEFLNTRPTSDKKKQAHEYHGITYTAEDEDLKGFKDPYDGPLYDAAKERFYSMLQEHGVNRASCEKTCAAASERRPFSLDKDKQTQSAPSTDDVEDQSDF